MQKFLIETSDISGSNLAISASQIDGDFRDRLYCGLDPSETVASGLGSTASRESASGTRVPSQARRSGSDEKLSGDKPSVDLHRPVSMPAHPRT
jgi:hypothetical protein